MRTLRPITILATTAVLGLTLSGCGAISNVFGGGGDEKLSYEDSPLNEYMSALYGGDLSPENMEERFNDEQLQMEEAVAACMQDEGFEYVPNVPESSGMLIGSAEDSEDPDWVAKYGYGIFTDPWEDEQQEAPDEEIVDPNSDYVESLSESEQEAYWEVLSGESPSEEQLEDPAFDWSTLDTGCYGDAQELVYDTGALEELMEEYEPLMDKMNALYDEASESDALVEANGAWAECMADAGFADFDEQSDAIDLVIDKQTEIYDSTEDLSEDVDWDSLSEEEIEELSAMQDPSGSPEWEEAADEEIKVAVADLECRDESDYQNITLKAQFELEEQFIEDNKTELEAFRAAAEQVM